MGGFGSRSPRGYRSDETGKIEHPHGLAKPMSIGPAEIPQQARALAIPAPGKEGPPECLTKPAAFAQGPSPEPFGEPFLG
jgi:hypothetical protein